MVTIFRVKNATSATCAGRPTYAAATSRSFHTGIVNSLLMDGSVRSVSENIDINVGDPARVRAAKLSRLLARVYGSSHGVEGSIPFQVTCHGFSSRSFDCPSAQSRIVRLGMLNENEWYICLGQNFILYHRRTQKLVEQELLGAADQ